MLANGVVKGIEFANCENKGEGGWLVLRGCSGDVGGSSG